MSAKWTLRAWLATANVAQIECALLDTLLGELVGANKLPEIELPYRLATISGNLHLHLQRAVKCHIAAHYRARCSLPVLLKTPAPSDSLAGRHKSPARHQTHGLPETPTPTQTD